MIVLDGGRIRDRLEYIAGAVAATVNRKRAPASAAIALTLGHAGGQADAPHLSMSACTSGGAPTVDVHEHRRRRRVHGATLHVFHGRM